MNSPGCSSFATSSNLPPLTLTESAVYPEPRITFTLTGSNREQIEGSCLMCKLRLHDWKALKEHVVHCRRVHQHPLLMRTAHCTFCMKKLADAYSLTAHITRCHPMTIHKLKEEVGRIAQVERDGYPLRSMRDPFPFLCSSCNICWPTAEGIAEHFVQMEKSRKPCGGHLIVLQSRDASSSSSDDKNETSINRYEFVTPEVCPYCTRTFNEAFEMSNHIGTAHGKHQQDLERKLARTISKNPMAKHEYEPFVCTGLKCGASFKRMNEWSAHYSENVMNRTPCYGELLIASKTNGKQRRKGNSAALAPSGPSQNNRDCETPIKDEMPELARENGDSSTKKEIKEEPMDADDVPSTSFSHIPVENPQSSMETHDYILPRINGATAAESGNAVVKEEPLDEEEGQTVVKEEPPDEPSTSNAGMGRVKVEGGVFECKYCNVIFTDYNQLMEHTKIHVTLIDFPVVKRRRMNGHPATCSFNNADNTHELKQPSKSTIFPFLCKHCKKRRFKTLDDCKEHELPCRKIILANSRDRAFVEPITCIFCKKGQANVYVLRNHMRSEHGDTIKKLRKHFMMASEFLPFRCSACKVGFEDPRVLLNHFRLREEFGVPCTGNLFLHHYEFTLMERKKLEETYTVQIPTLPSTDKSDSGESDECPRDPAPSVDYVESSMVKCPQCDEIWPRSQIKLHVKMEHPKYYYENAPYRCKTCKQYGFWCKESYADHYETCRTESIGLRNIKSIPCAPRCEDAFAIKGRPSSFKWKLPILPEDIGNELRQCRFCDMKLPPEGLLQHRKEQHPVKHFTDAPYQCQKCGDVGFYTHTLYKKHLKKCTGTAPTELESNIYVITAPEVERRANVQRIEIPSYRALIDLERREHGTYAALHRPTKCPSCDVWCSSMITLAEHYRDGHKNKEVDPFVCGGCGLAFTDIVALHGHLKNQNVLGESMCFDMAVVFDIRTTKRAPPVSVFGSTSIREMNLPMRPPPAHRSNVVLQRPVRASPLISRLGKISDKQIKSEDRAEFARRQAEARRKMMLPIRPINLMAKSPLMGERAAYRQQELSSAVNRQPARASYFIAAPPVGTTSTVSVQSQQGTQQSRPLIVRAPTRVIVPPSSQQNGSSYRPTISRTSQFASNSPGILRSKPVIAIPNRPGSQLAHSRPVEPKVEPKEEPNT